ncbi:SMR family transporter [Paraburkholderia sp. USG1]|uniref:DMT family transporter n=1 Tax=Paraburkholderia sp. USG1 TaxID=2952268 RepID=UPI0028605AFB|nr:SMR family transporter [Paraburkholderia sp. USG1]MDR8398390.1 SMR family transporter [Paraburkholderia sp. USG1]
MPAIQIAWILLGVSVTAEVLGTIGLKISVGFTHPLPTAFTVARYTGAVWLMAISTKHIEIGMHPIS